MRRVDAIRAGEKFYFTGKPCRNGNIAKRLTSAGKCWCDQCRADHSSRSARWQKDNPESTLARVRAWQARNPEKVAAIRAKGKQKTALSRNRWALENRGRVRANVVRYRTSKIRACPPWADQGAIRKIYEKAAKIRRDGIDVHVDHIVPLRGKGVCGLHVDYNLQVLGARENLSKSNKHERRAQPAGGP